MATTKFIQHVKSLKRKLKQREYAGIRDRIRAVIMIIKDYPYREIAENLGYSIQWVKKLAVRWLHRPFDEGAPGFRRVFNAGSIHGALQDCPGGAK
jgi:hypothetical protein